MSQIKIIDNFLNKSYHLQMLDLLNSFDFPWYYQANISNEGNENSLKEFGFSHIFVDKNGPRPSNFYFFIYPFILKLHDELNTNKILRCRADMTVNSESGHIHEYHKDYDIPNIATVYYVNDSDGDTIFKDSKEKITPKANRLIIFDGSLLHTGSSPKNSKTRVLLNSNFVR